ncbi:TPA: hemagglutinin repeat-containing protein [Campylobacter coli]|nr:hemagglutinin repeat-containing protein [Campylobacter coli]HEF9853894.1 hemagglutinin repeat-containing protein [Campylobacter coli]
MYANALQSNTKLSEEEIKKLLENGAKYANENGLNLGQGLAKNQAVDQDMILYVTIKQNGKNIMAPMLYLSKETIGNNEIKSNLTGKTGVDINTQSFNSLLGGIASEGQININAGNEINLQSSNLNAQNINLSANNVNIDTVLGIDEKGSYNSIKKGEIKANNVVNIDSVNDLNIKNSDISTSANDSKIVLISQKGDVNIKNDYSKSSSFEQINTDSQKSNTTTSIDGVLSTNIKGANVGIVSNQDVNIIASNINANNVNIKDAHELSKTKTDGVYLKPVEISYESANLETSKSISSTLNSKGDININTNGNIAITGSTLQADKSANLNGENKISSSSHSSTSSIAGYKQSSVNTDTSLVSSSQIQSDILNLNAQKNVSIKGSELNGGEIDIKADKVDFIAAQNKTHTESDSIAIGVFANANLELTGNGVAVNYSFVQDKANANTTNSSNSITQGGVRSDLLGTAEAGLEFSKTEKISDELSHVSNTIKGSNININANNALDIGGANFEANKDINLRAGEIVSTKYEDIKTQSSTGFGLYIKERIEATSPIASAINQSAQNAAAKNENLGVNYGIVASQALANTANIFSNNLINTTSNQTLGFKFNQDKSQSSSENISKINAGDNLNLESTKGSIVLNGVEAKASSINIEAKDNVILNAAKSKNSSSSSSLEIATNKQTAGYHAVDGGTVGEGIEGFASASYSKSNETQFTNANLNANNININTGKDFTLNGANVKASNDAILNVGNLEVNSLADSLNSQKYSALLNASGTGGLSSNHLVTGSVSGTLGIGYAKTDKTTVTTQSGISAGNEINGHVNGNLNLQGGILNSDNQKGNLLVDGKVTNSEVSVYEKSDVATIRLSGGTNQSFGGVVHIDDHIDKTGSVNSAANININNNKNHGISTDTQNTTDTQDHSWAGGTINLNSSISKIKNGISKVTGSDSTSNQPSNQPSKSDGPYINESTQTTRL